MDAHDRPSEEDVLDAIDAMKTLFDVESDSALMRILFTLLLHWPKHRRGGITPMLMLCTAASTRDIDGAKKVLGVTSDTQWLQVATALLRSIALQMGGDHTHLQVSKQSLLEAVAETRDVL